MPGEMAPAKQSWNYSNSDYTDMKPIQLTTGMKRVEISDFVNRYKVVILEWIQRRCGKWYEEFSCLNEGLKKPLSKNCQNVLTSEILDCSLHITMNFSKL